MLGAKHVVQGRIWIHGDLPMHGRSPCGGLLRLCIVLQTVPILDTRECGAQWTVHYALHEPCQYHCIPTVAKPGKIR